MMRQTRLPGSRLQRLFKIGRMASSVAGAMASEGVRQAFRGEGASARDLLLTPANAAHIAERLAEMRGAAMKIGQLLSLEAGAILPPEVTSQLARLRDSAHTMPPDQLHEVLEKELGPQWRGHFQRFDETPFAAASIGQVHEAIDQKCRRLAVKLQYPGVARSIDSDVDNAIGLIKLFRLLPAGLDISELVATAKAQLHDEADYSIEAAYLQHYRDANALAGNPNFLMPEVLPQLSTRRILSMTFVEGDNIESLMHCEDRSERDRVARLMTELTLREFLQSGIVQSDPNFSNFRYNGPELPIGLVDFGAVRILDTPRVAAIRSLIEAVRHTGLGNIAQAAADTGYFSENDDFNYRLAVVDLLKTAAEPALQRGAYDFANARLAQRLGEKLLLLRQKPDYQRLPASDIFYLHRKLAGLYMLLSRLRARVDVGALVEQVLGEVAVADAKKAC